VIDILRLSEDSELKELLVTEIETDSEEKEDKLDSDEKLDFVTLMLWELLDSELSELLVILILRLSEESEDRLDSELNELLVTDIDIDSEETEDRLDSDDLVTL